MTRFDALIVDKGSSLCAKVNTGVMYTREQCERTLKRHRVMETICEGIGLDRMTRNFERALPYIDQAVFISDKEVVDMARHLLDKDGLFLGSSSALNVAAAVKVAKEVGPGHVIVTMLCSSGEREATKLYNETFCKDRDLL